MQQLLLVCAGGAVGAGTRHIVNVWFAGRGWTGFPWATLLINVTGSALMGVVVGCLLARPNAPPEVRLFLATGILGGYTTFSAFSLEAWSLAQNGQILTALLYILGSVALSIAALGAALAASRWLMS